ncbi:hypothetical protein TcYC6_0085600 [Trypanosoma cruzi]|nr:hypothetical protein TcYC6_0085600 [Trypanosoma cruzi]
MPRGQFCRSETAGALVKALMPVDCPFMVACWKLCVEVVGEGLPLGLPPAVENSTYRSGCRGHGILKCLMQRECQHIVVTERRHIGCPVGHGKMPGPCQIDTGSLSCTTSILCFTRGVNQGGSCIRARLYEILQRSCLEGSPGRAPTVGDAR